MIYRSGTQQGGQCFLIKQHTEGYEVTLIPGLAEPTIHDRSLNFEIQNETCAYPGTRKSHSMLLKFVLYAVTATLRAHITSIMLQLLVPPPTLSSSITHRVVKYAPRYRLAFTLLNQDAASGKAAITWDAHNSINRPLCYQLLSP